MSNITDSAALQLTVRVSVTLLLRTAVPYCCRSARPLSPRRCANQSLTLEQCLVLVQQTLTAGSHFESPLLNYMAVRSVTRQGAWCTPSDCYTILRRLCYGLCLTLLGALRADWLLLPNTGVHPTTDAAMLATDALHCLCQQWLRRVGTPPTVSSAMRRVLHYVKLVARNAQPQRPVICERAPELVCYRHVWLRLPQWYDTVGHLVALCWHTLHLELVFALLGTEHFLLGRQLRED
jgi:hypothetical protein